MNNRKVNILVLALLICVPLMAQLNEQDVRQRLDLIHSGKIEQVRIEVVELLKQLPNDPGVRYLEAYVTENGDQAVKKYQAFVDNFPKNEWADDALYKVYQYYYAVGLYKTADVKLAQLNEQYPNSIFAKSESKAVIKTESQPSIKQDSSQPIVEEKREVVTPANTSGGFLVQVGVYSQEAKALQQANELTSTIGKKVIVFSKVSAGKTVFAIAFDGFTDENSAKTYGAELKSKYNLDWFVVKR